MFASQSHRDDTKRFPLFDRVAWTSSKLLILFANWMGWIQSTGLPVRAGG